MYYAKLDKKDSTNGVGFGVSLFVSGCRNHCKGCFNKETWCFTFGKEFTQETLDELLKLVSRPYIDFFSLLGGDPMEPENVETCVKIVSKVREVNPSIKVYCWTGYYFEDLIQNTKTRDLISKLDVLIDSPFILAQKDIRLHLKGSYNQRVIDARKSVNLKLPVALDDEFTEDRVYRLAGGTPVYLDSRVQ